MAEINITYETLFEILRLEKNRVDLQKLEKDFYKNVSVYIKEKTQMFKNDETDVEIKQKQLRNVKKIVEDIYFRRQKKIVNAALALNQSPGSLIEKEKMLDEEREFYEKIMAILLDDKKKIIDTTDGKAAVKDEPKPVKDIIMVRFLKDVPKFIGENLEEYGPFQEEDMTKLPKKLADILITKGSAEEIDA